MHNYHKELTQKEINQFIIERFQECQKQCKKARELVEFQAMNKYSNYGLQSRTIEKY